MYEIELKAHVKEVSKVSETLHKIAKFIHSVKKEDSYYTLEKDSKKITARIRKETEFLNGEKKESFFLTYKKKEMKLNNSGKLIEVNDEKETYLSSEDALSALFIDSGFNISLKKTKEVKVFQTDTKAGKCTLELCNVEPLGFFLEIEILSEKNDLQTVKNAEEIIKNFFFQCSLKESDIEEKYYSELLKECQ